MALAVAFIVFTVLTAVIAAFGYIRYVRPAQLVGQLMTRERPEAAFSLATGPVAESKLVELLMTLGKLMTQTPGDIKLARRELEAGGFRSDSAVGAYAGARVAGTILLGVFGFGLRIVFAAPPVLQIVMVLGGAVAGYFAPGLLLDKCSDKRRAAIRAGLPDALDLLVICAEAGSALDQSLVTVSRELVGAHPALCDELNILNLEVLAGKTRQEALRNFANRSGEDEVAKLVALLVQTDRFGTSVSEALRTQSESMRIMRQQLAEERAGKVGVKLVFPIFFFCLPSLFIIAAGPGMLQLFRTLPALAGGH